MFRSIAPNLFNTASVTHSPFRKRVLPFLAICAVLLIAGLVFYFFGNHNSQDWRKNTAKVERGSIDVLIIATGTIRPVNEVKVSPKMVGLIKRLYVKQGDFVKEG